MLFHVPPLPADLIERYDRCVTLADRDALAAEVGLTVRQLYNIVSRRRTRT